MQHPTISATVNRAVGFASPEGAAMPNTHVTPHEIEHYIAVEIKTVPNGTEVTLYGNMKKPEAPFMLHHKDFKVLVAHGGTDGHISALPEWLVDANLIVCCHPKQVKLSHPEIASKIWGDWACMTACFTKSDKMFFTTEDIWLSELKPKEKP